MKASPKHAPREEFLRIHSAHRLLKRWAQFAVARTKNSRRGVPRSGGVGGEIPHEMRFLPLTTNPRHGPGASVVECSQPFIPRHIHRAIIAIKIAMMQLVVEMPYG